MHDAKKNERYGRGEYRLSSPDALLCADPSALVERMRAVLLSDSYQPPVLPAVALQLLELSRDPNVPFQKIKALARTEPLIAAKLLRLARTAYFARGATIESLDDAISRLGLKMVSELFLREALTTRVFKAPDYQQPMEALRRHSVVVADLSRAVCRLIGFPDEYAYMCGLLHDVGGAAAILIVAERERGKEPPSYDEVAGVIETVHEEASTVLARAWKLPEDVRLVVGHHHHFKIDGRVHPLAAAVCLADGLAAAAGAGFGSEIREMQVKSAIDALALSEADVATLNKQAQKVVEANP